MSETDARPWRLRDELSYLVLSAVLLVWTVAVVVQGRWIGDFSLHVATVRTLAADLASPPDPMIGVPGGSPYDSPYTLVLALVVRLTHLSPVLVLEIAAVVNVAVLLAAWRWASSQLVPGAAPAALSLIAVLLLWGWNPPAWSGFPNVWSVALTAAYPSLLALGLELLAWSCLWRLRRPGASPRWAAGVGVLVALLVLIHPFTALTALLGLASIAVVRLRDWQMRPLAALAAAAVAALVLVLAWPYSSPGQLLAGDRSFDEIHRPLVDAATGLGGFQAYGLMLLALPALAWALRARRHAELALMVALAVAVFVLAVLTGRLAYTRVVPLAMVAGALGLGQALVTWWRSPATRAGKSALSRRRASRPAALGLGLAVAVACAVGLIGQRAAIAVALPTGDVQRAITPAVPPPFGTSIAALDRLVADGETVAATSGWGRRRLNAAGAFTLVPGWPDPFSDAVPERQRAYDRLVAAATTPAERARIAARFQLRCVLVVGAPSLTRPGRLAPFDQVHPLPDGGQLLCRDRRSL